MNIVQPTTSQSSLSNDLIAKFRKIVGDKYALTDKADIAPYTTEVVLAVRCAREQGTPVLAITDDRLSPIGRAADATLLVAAAT